MPDFQGKFFPSNHGLHVCILHSWAVLLAQLLEPLLPTPEISGSNPNISKIFSTNWIFR